MATYVITAPDGQDYEIDAPEGASEQDALAYFQQNWKQEAPPELLARPQEAPMVSPAQGGGGLRGELARVSEGRNPVTQLGSGVVDAFLQGGAGIRQLYNKVADPSFARALQGEEAQARKEWERVDPSGSGVSPQDVGRIGGTLWSMMAPGSAATKAAPALARSPIISGALAGGAEGAIQPTVEGESVAENALLGTLLGGGGGSLAKGGGALVERFGGKTKNQLREYLVDALSSKGKTASEASASVQESLRVRTKELSKQYGEGLRKISEGAPEVKLSGTTTKLLEQSADDMATALGRSSKPLGAERALEETSSAILDEAGNPIGRVAKDVSFEDAVGKLKDVRAANRQARKQWERTGSADAKNTMQRMTELEKSILGDIPEAQQKELAKLDEEYRAIGPFRDRGSAVEKITRREASPDVVEALFKSPGKGSTLSDLLKSGASKDDLRNLLGARMSEGASKFGSTTDPLLSSMERERLKTLQELLRASPPAGVNLPLMSIFRSEPRAMTPGLAKELAELLRKSGGGAGALTAQPVGE